MRENALSKAVIVMVAGRAVAILEMALGTNNDLMIWSKSFHWWTFPKSNDSVQFSRSVMSDSLRPHE